ncbi:MAG TPA: DUF4352 domain-containing protein [Candidatus Eremiobacteraceae bacterium]|jgi:hypothetical protein
MDKRLQLLIGAGIFGAAVIAGFIYFYSGSPPYQVAIGEPIRQDDFLYTVVGVTKARTVGDDAHRAVAHGVFYVTTIQVDNQAMRVGYQWDPSIVFVTDDAGNRYSMSLDAQRAIDATRPVGTMIDAGRSARYEVAFDLPSDTRHPVLGFSNGVMMGDVFNGAAYTRARVPLE